MGKETSTSAIRLGSDGVKPTTTASSDLEHNPNSNSSPSPQATGSDSTSRQSSTTPFTNLSQLDLDFAVARTLQELEMVHMMLSMTRPYGDQHDHIEEDDNNDVADDEVGGGDSDPNFGLDRHNYSSEEAYARALQNAQTPFSRDWLHDQDLGYSDDEGENTQDRWRGVDPDHMSYEELLELGEAIGTESRGLSADSISSLPSIKFKAGNNQTGTNDSCVICLSDFEDDETVTVLSCKHSYHSKCINTWLEIHKVCPVCNAEISTATDSCSTKS